MTTSQAPDPRVTAAEDHIKHVEYVRASLREGLPQLAPVLLADYVTKGTDAIAGLLELIEEHMFTFQRERASERAAARRDGAS